MTDSDRIDELQAQLIAYGLALRYLVMEVPAVRDAIPSLAKDAAESAIAESLTDEQIEQIRRTLLSLC